MRPLIDLAGKRFGRLFVISRGEKTKDFERYYNGRREILT